MNIVITLITILVFPLNVLLAVLPAEKNAVAVNDVVLENNNFQGKVEGEEKKKEEVSPKVNPPERDEKVENLAVPNAHASIILDVDSSAVLYESESYEHRQIASLTKLMTAVLVMEKVKNLDEIVTIDADSVYAEGTKIGCPRSGYCITQRLKVGEKISVGNLLKAMLMNSANDAAIALAKHIGGSEENFAELMNKKTKQLGLSDTNFCTASGLEIDGRESECYSSAHDIARIASYAMQYDLIWEIFRLPNNTIIASEDGTCEHQILNTDIILDQVPNCLGGKTGFTPLAGRSLMIAASDDTKKHRIIAVVLDDPYRWQDVQKMVNWAFRAYIWNQ
jgi:serine-type D-Ala-D-Ala carboxypeptidase (penicillin-binding protein 5/6)